MANTILKQYLLKGHVINESRCLAHSDSMINLYNTIENMQSNMNKFNDRFFIIDYELYNVGSSIKDIGKKISHISKLESIDIDDLLSKYEK